MKLRKKKLTPEEEAALLLQRKEEEARQLRDDHHANTAWVDELKKLLDEMWTERVDERVDELEREFREHASNLVPRLWRIKAFWQEKRWAWRQEAEKSVADHAERELNARNQEITQLQVRLSVILTFTTAGLALVSLRAGLPQVAVAFAALTACTVLGIALSPLGSKYAQAFRNNYEDPAVWSVQATSPRTRFCLARGATAGRNRVVKRYKRVLWLLVPLMRVVLLVLAGSFAAPLFI